MIFQFPPGGCDLKAIFVPTPGGENSDDYGIHSGVLCGMVSTLATRSIIVSVSHVGEEMAFFSL